MLYQTPLDFEIVQTSPVVIYRHIQTLKYHWADSENKITSTGHNTLKEAVEDFLVFHK